MCFELASYEKHKKEYPPKQKRYWQITFAGSAFNKCRIVIPKCWMERYLAQLRLVSLYAFISGLQEVLADRFIY